MRLLFIFLVLLNNYDKHCIYIGGGGFSGFWYFYNKTQSLDEFNKIYCFSSGCLAVTAGIYPNNYNNIFNSITTIKEMYKNNTITFYDIREKFIDSIINIPINKYNLNIITSTYSGNCIIKRPDNKSHFKILLLETTNIPIITNKINFKNNIDGIFCIHNHPKCKITYNIPKTFRFIINIFNPFLKNKDIEYFYNWPN